jgi:hypothetical protein
MQFKVYRLGEMVAQFAFREDAARFIVGNRTVTYSVKVAGRLVWGRKGDRLVTSAHLVATIYQRVELHRHQSATSYLEALDDTAQLERNKREIEHHTSHLEQLAERMKQTA